MKRTRIKKFKRELRKYWESIEYKKNKKIKNEISVHSVCSKANTHLLDSYWESKEFLEKKKEQNKVSYQMRYLINYFYVIEAKNVEEAINTFLSKYPKYSIISFKPLSTVGQINREKIPYNFKK